MLEMILQWFETSGWFASGISVFLNVVISVLGLVPSVFLTTANISFFGFQQGVVLSIVGEAFGAVVSFYLYRKGISRVKMNGLVGNKYVQMLQQTKGWDAFLLIFSFRILPFIPSGVVTLASAGSRVGWLNFLVASTLGKIPALVIEAYSIQQVLDWSWRGKWIVGISLLVVVYVIGRRLKKARSMC